MGRMNSTTAEANVPSTSLVRRAGDDLAYLVAILGTSILAFGVWVATLTATVSLIVFVVGVFVWFGSTYAYRWTTRLDRALAGWSRGEAVAAVYRPPRSGAFLDRLRGVTTDPQTWRDLGWLVLNSFLGFAFALVGLIGVGVALSYVLMPLWWWAISNPGDQYGTLNVGLYTVHSTGWAFVSTAIGLALMPLALLVNRGLVAAHSGLAARILGR